MLKRRETMKKEIDCLLIGHNQVDYQEYEKSVRDLGTNSGAYNDLKKNFIRYNGKNYNAADVFNLFCCYDNLYSDSVQPIGLVETFSNGIAYLGTYLHRRGLTFDYINSFQDEKEELAEKLSQQKVLTVGILTTLYVSTLPIFEIVEFIREHNKTAKIVIGGPLISTKCRTLDEMEFRYLLKSMGADFYVNNSQGEAALVNIIRTLKKDLAIENVNNIYFKKGSEYTGTPLVQENNMLADNMVDWDLFEDVGNFVNIRTCISCPFSCAFCGFPQHAGQYQTAPVEAIEKELNRLAKKEMVRSIHFVDDTFNIPLKRFKDILRMMIKNKYPFKWSSFLRCQYADKEMLDLMKESGCESVIMGLESGSNAILRNMNKKVTVEDYGKGLDLINAYGIISIGNFVVGFPGETEQTVQESIDFIKESGIDFYRSQLWYCEPITPIWQQRETYNITGEHFEWSHSTMDSRTASKMVDKMILAIDRPTRFPQYYFDYDNIVQLFYKGVSLEQTDRFLQAFNQGIREKILYPYHKEASFEVIKQVKESCCGESGYSSGRDDELHNISEEEPVEFDF
jgi:anaerobic magnesium-protoporphyrin IX monomethyl ester cyclase